MKRLTLVPAYGRDYKSKKAVLEDFTADKDFIIADISQPWDGKPINRQDLLTDGFTEVNIRYKNLRNVAVIPVK